MSDDITHHMPCTRQMWMMLFFSSGQLWPACIVQGQVIDFKEFYSYKKEPQKCLGIILNVLIRTLLRTVFFTSIQSLYHCSCLFWLIMRDLHKTSCIVQTYTLSTVLTQAALMGTEIWLLAFCGTDVVESVYLSHLGLVLMWQHLSV